MITGIFFNIFGHVWEDGSKLIDDRKAYFKAVVLVGTWESKLGTAWRSQLHFALLINFLGIDKGENLDTVIRY